MLDWFKKLMPKEEKFFDLFEAHAAKAQEAARSLRAIVEGGPDMASHCATLVARRRRRRTRSPMR